MAFKGHMGSGGDFQQATPGMVSAVLARIIDWGTQEWGTFGPARRVQLVWEINEEVAAGEFAGKHLTVSNIYTLSFNEKSNLMKDLQSWRGRAFGPDDEIDLHACIGKPAMLNLVVSPKGDRINVGSVSPMVKGMQPLVPDQQPLVFDLDEPDWDAWARLHEKTQEKIAVTKEYKAATGHKAQPSQVTRNPSGSRGYAADPVSDGHTPAVDFDDDIPF